MNNIDDESAGTFRRVDSVGIQGCDLVLCPSELIEEELQKSISEYYESLEQGRYPFESAIWFHYKFETIHPFSDGNGRVGREILNFMLVKEKYPKLLFLGKDREFYLDALRLGNENHYGEMIHAFATLFIKQMDKLVNDYMKKIVIPPKKEGQLRLNHFDISGDD
jgi:Fic family protein